MVNVSPNRLRLYWDTIRHLKPVQIYRRLWFRTVQPVLDYRAAPPLRAYHASKWIVPARRRQSLLGAAEFRFLNETRALSEIGWDNPTIPKLWSSNLHYFDDLNAVGAAARTEWHVALVARWIAENPPGRGLGWEPCLVSYRIVNWIKWARAGGNALSPEAINSMALQARWLVKRLEYHLLGNHLFSNAKALVFAGCFFEGSEADRWLELGLRILEKEIPEQILPDGGQFELSPMYHCLALEDMLDLVNVLRCASLPIPEQYPKKIDDMIDWLVSMSHPDGEISFFNDSAFGIAPPTSELYSYAERLSFALPSKLEAGCHVLRDSGYVRIQNDGAVALIDVARVGPDYLPGHSHADTLSFELSVGGRRMLVNSGTSVYGGGAERQRQRGTAAHNTVVVNGRDSSEVWSGFRVARRARPQDVVVDGGGAEWRVSGAHDGYRRLPGRPIHRRAWRLRDGVLVVSDAVESGRETPAEASFHFPSDLSASIGEDGQSGCLFSGGDMVLRWHIQKGQGRLDPATWHPEFGISLPSSKLVVALSHNESLVEFIWDEQHMRAIRG